MKKLLVVVIVLAFAVPCLAQTAQPPKPGPEVQKLGYFIGTWKMEGERKATSTRPATKFSDTDTCEWFAGGFHVVCRGEGIGPEGTVALLRILAYDAAIKAYTVYSISSQGDSMSAKGSLTASTWTWPREGKVAGKPAKFRLTQVQELPTAYTSKAEYSVAGGPWTVVMEGKSTKVR